MPPADSPTAFARLADGTTLLRQADGSFRTVRSETDLARVRAMTDADIEHQAASDPDHPGLDEAFWSGIDARRSSSPEDLVRLDPDVLSHFRHQGKGYEARINTVLRRYVEALRERERRRSSGDRQT